MHKGFRDVKAEVDSHRGGVVEDLLEGRDNGSGCYGNVDVRNLFIGDTRTTHRTTSGGARGQLFRRSRENAQGKGVVSIQTFIML